MKMICMLILLIISCSTPMPDSVYPEYPDPKLRAAMRFQVDGSWYSGTTILPRRNSGTTINIELPKETRFLLFNSCRREWVYENPEQKMFRFDFVPVQDKENKGSCAILVTAVTRSGEFHRAVIDFENATGRDLVAKVACNDDWKDYEAACICQNRASNDGSIKFDVEVISSGREKCPALRCVSGCRVVNGVQIGKEFDFAHGEGMCGYDFQDQQKRLFRLTTIGYTSILNVFPPKK